MTSQEEMCLGNEIVGVCECCILSESCNLFLEDPIRSDLKKSRSNVACCKRVWDPIRKKRYRSYGYGAQQARGLGAHAGGLVLFWVVLY